MGKRGKKIDEQYVAGEVTEEVWDALGAVDEMRLATLRGVAQRLGLGATLAEVIAFYEAPKAEPPPDRVPPSRRPKP